MSRRTEPKPLRVSLTSRFASTAAGGIEAVVAEMLPRLRAAHPNWQIRGVRAFGSRTVLGRIPLICDLVGAVILAWRTRNDDAVVMNGAEYAFVRLAFPRLRARTIVVWHGTRAGEIPALAPRMTIALRVYAYVERVLQRMAFAAPQHLAVGENVAEELTAAYGRTPALRLATNGAPTISGNGHAADASSPRVLWVGTNAYKKGLDLALAACRLSKRSNPGLRLDVVGLDDAGPDPWALAHGRQPHERMASFFDECALVLVTSRYEACSMAVLEAIAHGKAIVPSTSVAWMVRDEALSSPEEFAAAIDDALLPEGRLRRERLALDARTRFRWDASVPIYVAAIESVVGEA